MNQNLFLHVVERLESLIGKLPAAIQKPILSELTPLKELFLQQRPPRLLFTGSASAPLAEILSTIFAPGSPFKVLAERFRWQQVELADRGTMSIIDGREAPPGEAASIQEELKRQPADFIIFVDDAEGARAVRKPLLENLRHSITWNDAAAPGAKVIGIVTAPQERAERTRSSLEAEAAIGERLLEVVSFAGDNGPSRQPEQFMAMLARELPNEARIEMIRISGNKEAQHQVAQILVKSTTAICSAIGAQPIPLADMPILTTLQLVMVSGIMYVSGRERSLRAATEFVGALGANVGAGMLLREGARAILKFFPGWGNVVSGMVAGAGTYAIGRAATVFFLEGVSLKDARRTYIKSRKKSPPPELEARKGTKMSGRRRKSAARPGRTNATQSLTE